MNLNTSERSTLRRPWQVLTDAAPAVAGGLGTGAFAAWAYYDELLRPVAHTFALWITLVVLVSARRPFRQAVLHAGLALAAAVLAFYGGKGLLYGVHYPGGPFLFNGEQLVTWLVLAVVAGIGLGWASSAIGTPGWRGDAATAGAVGLLIADGFRRSSGYPGDAGVVLPLTVLGILAVLAVAIRSPRQLPGVLLWTLPMALVGLAVVSAPDLLEQLMITGRPW